VPDVREFRAVCHAAARQTAGSLVEFRLATHTTPSFHQGVIAYRDETVAVVCDRSRPLLAIARPRLIEDVGGVDAGPLTFLDVPELRRALETLTGHRVLTTAELDAPFEPADWPHLATGDVRYWRPATVGEALFNYWD
jgi:hypothetical protein